MKKITFILAFIGMIGLQSCTVNETTDTVDNDTISEVLELTTSFSGATNANFYRMVTISPPIYTSDMILVYHLYGVDSGTGLDIWRLMPQTYYLPAGELDYNYDFTTHDVKLFMDADFNMNTLSAAWTQNQTFRIVIIPGYFSGRTSSKVDFNDYDATLKAYNINPSKIRKIKA